MTKLAIEGGEKAVMHSAPRWPKVDNEEIEAVTQALKQSRSDTRFLTAPAGGGVVGEFEEQFARFMGSEYAMTTSGGGPALHIAVMAAGVQAGDEVIVSPYTWGQTVSCILQQMAIPVFADIDPRTYTLDPASVEERISPHTKAIVVVHLYGHPADMAPIMEIARAHRLKVIEDCAQTAGAICKGRRVGTIGDFGCFSIGSGKQMIGGEGGLVLTQNDRDHQLASLFGQHPARHAGEIKDADLKKQVDNLIFTYRIHPLAAVIANVQLDKLDGWNAQRRKNYNLLTEGLGDMLGTHPVHTARGCEHVFHIYCPTFSPESVDGISREMYVKALSAEGVPIGMGYVRQPIHLRHRMQAHDYFFGGGYPWKAGHRSMTYQKGDCPVAEHRCASTELTLGGGASWYGDQSELVKAVLYAFEKVTDNLDVLRRLEREQELSQKVHSGGKGTN